MYQSGGSPPTHHLAAALLESLRHAQKLEVSSAEEDGGLATTIAVTLSVFASLLNKGETQHA